MIPIFTSDASLGKSILTTDLPKYDTFDKSNYESKLAKYTLAELQTEITKVGIKMPDDKDINKENLCKLLIQKFDIINSASTSIFSLAKVYNLEQIFLLENSMVSFITAYKNAAKLNKQLVFGIKLIITPDPSNKEDKSKLSDSNVIVWMKNSDGYKDLIKLYSAVHGNADNYFWSKFDFKAFYRGTWKILQKYVTDNLVLTIPFYDSFLNKNLLTYGAMTVPEFGKLKPTFILEKHGLPFDDLLRNSVINYCNENKYDTIEGHTCYYYKDSDAKTFQIFKCINNREKYDSPNLSHFSSNKFSFESYLERIK